MITKRLLIGSLALCTSLVCLALIWSIFMQKRAMPEVIVFLDNEIDRIEGRKWPLDHVHNEPLDICNIDVPHNLVIILKSGNVRRHFSRATVISQTRRRVKYVTFYPLHEPEDFSEAAKDVQKISNESLFTGQSMESVLKVWTTSREPEYSVSTKGIVEDNVEIFIELKPFGSRQNRRWIVFMQYFLT